MMAHFKLGHISTLLSPATLFSRHFGLLLLLSRCRCWGRWCRCSPLFRGRHHLEIFIVGIQAIIVNWSHFSSFPFGRPLVICTFFVFLAFLGLVSLFLGRCRCSSLFGSGRFTTSFLRLCCRLFFGFGLCFCRCRLLCYFFRCFFGRCCGRFRRCFGLLGLCGRFWFDWLGSFRFFGSNWFCFLFAFLLFLLTLKLFELVFIFVNGDINCKLKAN